MSDKTATEYKCLSLAERELAQQRCDNQELLCACTNLQSHLQHAPSCSKWLPETNPHSDYCSCAKGEHIAAANLAVQHSREDLRRALSDLAALHKLVGELARLLTIADATLTNHHSLSHISEPFDKSGSCKVCSVEMFRAFNSALARARALKGE